MIKKNEEIILDITDLTVEGYGLGKYEGLAVFVPHALPDEKVRIRVIKQAKNYAVGRLMEILEESPDRVEPPCPHFVQCGGCTLQHLSYERQLQYKSEYVRNCLKRIGGLEIPVLNCEPSPKVFGYRNKTSCPVGCQDGQTVIGFYAPRSHRIVDIESCRIMDEKAEPVLKAAKKYLNDFNVPPYDESTGKGVIRHVVARCAKDGSVMAALVSNADTLPKEKECADLFSEEVKGLDSFILNVNKENTNVILGSQERTLYGADSIQDELLGLKFNVSLNSFLQVNREQAERLYEKALAYADIKEGDIVADLYCGIGTLTLAAAKKAKKVYGIEIVKSAIDNANENMRLNHIVNAEFICEDCSTALPKLQEREPGISVVLLDPPRKGCSPEVLASVVQVNPRRIVYVSCDSATLARDLAILEKGGYKAAEAAPFDMFPQTTHVETVILMTNSGLKEK